MNDKELTDLVRAIQGGDDTAFEQLFTAFAAEALRTACLICGNRASGEDVVQEAFVQTYLKIGTLRKPEQFRSWFYKMMTRIAWRGSGREKRQVPVADIYETAEGAQRGDALETYIRDEESKALYEAINRLPSKQKTVVVLHYFNGFTVAEIAHILGTLEGTVKSRLHTARKRLQEELSFVQQQTKGEISHAHG